MAPPAPRECNQPARSALHRNQFAAHRIPCSAAHCLASRASQRIASHPVQRSAPRECNQPARIGPRIANNPRTNNQPATHRPPRPLRIACRTANTSHLLLNFVSVRTIKERSSSRASQYFALVSFCSWY
jgi:hypothetical protein